MRQRVSPKPQQFISNNRVQADQKDVIISKLQSELDSLKRNEQEFGLLKEQYGELDRKYKAQLQQKSLLDSDFANRHDCALRHMSQLKNEIEAIRADLRDKKLETQDLRADEETIKNSLDQRNIEIQKLRTDMNALLCDSDELENQRIWLVGQAESLRNSNSNLTQEMLALEAEHQERDNRLAGLQKYLDQLEAQSQILKQKIKMYEDTNNDLDIQIQENVCDLSELENAIYQSQQNVSELQALNAGVGTNVEQFKSEAIHNQRSAQAEAMKNSQLIKRLKQAENSLRVRMGQVQEGHQQLECLREENSSLEKVNKELDEDLEACRRHLENLGQLNRQLISSLECFGEEDRRAGELINREQRTKQLSMRVEETSSVAFYSGKDSARTADSFSSSRRRPNRV